MLDTMSSTYATRTVDGRTQTPDGVEIAFRDYGGRGPDVVLLPGIGGNLEAEHETALQLADRWRIVTIDPRGIGQSAESETITTADLVMDIESVVSALNLHLLAVVGHSLGGIIAGHYGTAHPDVAVVSIDGFGGGVASAGTADDHEALHQFMEWARRSLRSMTTAPYEGDEHWKSTQIQAMNAALDTAGYYSPHRVELLARQFVRLPDGRWRRHPSAKLVDLAEQDVFGDEPPNIVSMFRTCTGPVLLIRCTRSEWPNVLDAELDELVATHPNIAVQQLPLTHTAPVTDGIEMTATEISGFLSRMCDANVV
jgi:pimeloyl-ACP methyl ester carboxylesterase